MKKYIPLDFDEKGKVILGNAKNTPTPNGTIPAVFIPGGSDEGKQGLKSITISPAITMTPALESFFPIYWEDLTAEQKQDGVTINCSLAGGFQEGEYTLTVEPTGEWYAGIIGWADGSPVFSEKGESVMATRTPFPKDQFTVVGRGTPDGDGDRFIVNINLQG